MDAEHNLVVVAPFSTSLLSSAPTFVIARGYETHYKRLEKRPMIILKKRFRFKEGVTKVIFSLRFF